MYGLNVKYLQASTIDGVPAFQEIVKKGFSQVNAEQRDLILWALDTQKFQICSCPRTKVIAKFYIFKSIEWKCFMAFYGQVNGMANACT